MALTQNDCWKPDASLYSDAGALERAAFCEAADGWAETCDSLGLGADDGVRAAGEAALNRACRALGGMLAQREKLELKKMKDQARYNEQRAAARMITLRKAFQTRMQDAEVTPIIAYLR